MPFWVWRRRRSWRMSSSTNSTRCWSCGYGRPGLRLAGAGSAGVAAAGTTPVKGGAVGGRWTWVFRRHNTAAVPIAETPPPRPAHGPVVPDHTLAALKSRLARSRAGRRTRRGCLTHQGVGARSGPTTSVRSVEQNVNQNSRSTSEFHTPRNATPVPGLRPERVAPSGQLWSRWVARPTVGRWPMSSANGTGIC